MKKHPAKPTTPRLSQQPWMGTPQVSRRTYAPHWQYILSAGGVYGLWTARMAGLFAIRCNLRIKLDLRHSIVFPTVGIILLY